MHKLFFRPPQQDSIDKANDPDLPVMGTVTVANGARDVTKEQ